MEGSGNIYFKVKWDIIVCVEAFYIFQGNSMEWKKWKIGELLLETDSNGQEKRKINWRKGVSLVLWMRRGRTGGAGVEREEQGASYAMTEESSHDPCVNRIQVLLKPAIDFTKLVGFVVSPSDRALLMLDKHSITEPPKVIFKTLKLISRLPLTWMFFVLVIQPVNYGWQ